MTTGSSISERLRRQSVVPVESTIPPELTIEQWRRRRCRRAASIRNGGRARLPGFPLADGPSAAKPDHGGPKFRRPAAA